MKFSAHKTFLRTGVSALFIAALLLLTSTSLFAQNAGFGSISGVVQDSTGAVVADAKVVVDNPSKGIHRELQTTDAGIFNAAALVPADGYIVHISKPGFSDYEAKNITLAVGQNVSLTPALKVGASGTEVLVTGEAPLVDTQKTSVSTVVGSDQILDLPINGRRVDAFVQLSPGVTNDGAFGLLSFRGTPGGNNFLTDGVDTTNAYYGENAGRTRTYNIAQDAVQEFQVVSANYAAEFGHAAGGVVNTVTRSGSNAYHGSAYEFFRNRTLNAIDRTTANKVFPNGVNPPEWRHQAGLSIGGPIKHDKLFFFFNGELFRRNAPAVSSNIGSGSGNNVFDGAGNVLMDPTLGAKNDQTCHVASTLPGGTVKLPSGNIVPAPTQAQCDAATAYVKGQVATQLIPRHMDNNMLFGKIDWHPTDKDSVSFSGNYLDFRSPNGIQTQLSLTDGSAIGNNADTNVFDRTGRISWTRVITPNVLNEFRFGLFKDRQYDPASPTLVPNFPAGASPVALTVNGVSNLGYATNYPRVNPSELRAQFSDNLTWTVGKHTLKFGGDFTRLEDFVQSMSGQYPTYTYSPLSSKIQDPNDPTKQISVTYNALTYLALDINGGVSAGNQAYSQFSQTLGNRQVDFTVLEAAFFAQDDYRITPKLTISPGVRYQYSTVPQPTTCNPNFPQTCKIPGQSGDFAPRVGFAYSFNDKTVIRGGYGIFNNRYITSSLENLLVTNGVYQNTYSYSGSSLTPTTLGCLPVFPVAPAFDAVPSGNCARTLNPGILYADPNLRPSYSEQANLSVEREVVKNLSLSVSYVWSRTLHLPVSYDTNLAAPTASRTYQILDTGNNIVGTYTTPIYTARNPVYTFNGQQYTGRVSVLQSAANSYYNAMLVNAKYRPAKWFQLDMAYTYGHTIDWGVGFAPTFGSTTPSSYVNGDYRGDKGSSQLDRRHNLMLNYIVAPTFLHNDSAFARYVVNGWQLSGVTQFASSQPQVPSLSGSIPTTFGGISVLNTSSLNGLGGSGRIPFMSVSALDIGAIYRTDARIMKMFPITERVNVNLGFEAFNVFNHLIPGGTAPRDRFAYTASIPTTGPNTGLLVLTPRTSYGSLQQTQITPDGTTARRAQAVIRINF
jgi:outer membrane receptor for ferrienterochelin and colicin